MIVALATGSGRCGTQTFAGQMQRLKGVVGVHEGVQMIGMNLPMNQRPRTPHLLCGQESEVAREWNLSALRARRQKFFSDGLEGYGESAHYFGLNMSLVEQVFPEAKLVHLVRNPVAMVWSMMNHARGDIYKNGQHQRHEDRWYWWGDCFPVWPGVETRAAGFAWYWQMVNEAIEQTRLPRLLVRTGDLKRSGTWEKILDFVGLGHLKVQLPGLAFNATNPKHKKPVPDDIRKVVEEICTWEPK